MKVNILSKGQSSTAVVQQCPHCLGHGFQVEAVPGDSSSTCSTCSRSRRGRNRKKVSGTTDGITEQKVSIVAVGNLGSTNEKKTRRPSLLGKIFNRSEREHKHRREQQGIDVHTRTTAQGSHIILAPTVTLLEVKSSARLSSSVDNLSSMRNEIRESTSNGVLCTKCNTHPAQISVTDSRGTRADKLCVGCHAFLQATKKSSSNQQPMKKTELVRRCESANPIDNRNTVVLVREDKCYRQSPMLYVPEANLEGSNNPGSTEKLLKILDDLKSTVLSSGANELPATTSAANVATTDAAAVASAVEVASNVVTKVTTNASVAREVRPYIASVNVSSGSPRNSQRLENLNVRKEDLNQKDEGFPVTVLSLSSGKVTMNTPVINGQNLPRNDQQPTGANNQSSSNLQVLATGGTQNDGWGEFVPHGEATDRPEAFNPDYRSTYGRSSELSVEMPAELEAVHQHQGRNFLSKAEEIFHGNLQRSANQSALMDEEYFAVPPPRYEDIIKESDETAAPDSHQVYFLKSFGRYSEISTQPGGLNNPTTAKLSRSHEQRTSPNLGADEPDVVVVTDQKLLTVQVFDLTGECLALLKVQGVKSCCPIDSKLLVVGTDDRVVVFDYNGVEKVGAGLDRSHGEVNSLSPLRTRESFVALTQLRAISIYDCRFSTLVAVKKILSASPKMPFKKLVDVSFTSNDDLVILDAGEGADSAAIYVINLSTEQLKSAIFPKHESCGPLSSPAALAVDRRNRILVSDQGNRRVVLFIPSKQTGNVATQQGERQGRIQVKTLNGLRLKGPTGSNADPAGICVNKDDLIFLVVKGPKTAEIRIYSGH